MFTLGLLREKIFNNFPLEVYLASQIDQLILRIGLS